MTNLMQFPGFIDTHVHTREPGLEYKATMATEARSALAGGVTVMCEMPNTKPPTVTIAALADKVRRAALAGFDYRFYFGMTNADHVAEFRTLCESDDEELRQLRSRCCGVKLFLEHSTGDQKIPTELVPEVFALCAKYDILLMAHCEDPDMNAAAQAANTRTDVAAHSIVRPAESEAASIAFALSHVRQFRTRFHIAHLTTRQGTDLLRQAKKEGLSVTGEVTVHNLFCNDEDYKTLGTRIKMNPPIRSREHQEALAEGIMDGTIDAIITDHAPHTLEEKNNPEPLKAPSGVPGVETRIPILLTLASGRWPHPTSPATILRITHEDIVRLCFTNLNNIFRLGKKTPEEGGDAVMVDLEEEWTVQAADLHTKCDWTPYEGWQMKGKVVEVKTESDERAKLQQATAEKFAKETVERLGQVRK